MKTPVLIDDSIIFRFECLANHLVGQKLKDLTEIEKQAFHLCRHVGMLTANFGPEGMDDGVIEVL